MSYYNTTEETGSELAESHSKAKTQEQAILNCFKRSLEPLSPSKILIELELLGWSYPITSIRRAISDLTTEGKLIKTDSFVQGIYGKREHLWRLPE